MPTGQTLRLVPGILGGVGRLAADPCFYPLQTSSPIPDVMRNQGLVDVIHQVSGRPGVATGIG